MTGLIRLLSYTLRRIIKENPKPAFLTDYEFSFSTEHWISQNDLVNKNDGWFAINIQTRENLGDVLKSGIKLLK